MDQIKMFDDSNPEEQAYECLKKILIKAEKTELTLESSKAQSYTSVGFNGKSVDFKIKFGRKISYLAVSSKHKNILDKYNVNYTYENPNLWLRISIKHPKDIQDYQEIILDIYDKRIEENSVYDFDCCSLYMECSDAKKCVQKIDEISKNCRYKKTLEKGIIFHGKNRNV